MAERYDKEEISAVIVKVWVSDNEASFVDRPSEAFFFFCCSGAVDVDFLWCHGFCESSVDDGLIACARQNLDLMVYETISSVSSAGSDTCDVDLEQRTGLGTCRVYIGVVRQEVQSPRLLQSRVTGRILSARRSCVGNVAAASRTIPDNLWCLCVR